MLTQNTWPANKSPAMCKTRHKHAAKEETHKPRVHTRQPMKYTSCMPHSTRHNMNARSLIKHEMRATQNTTRGQKSTWPSKLETACSQNETEHGARVSGPKLKTRVPGSEHHAPIRNKARRRESARLENTRSRALTLKTGHDGSVRALS